MDIAEEEQGMAGMGGDYKDKGDGGPRLDVVFSRSSAAEFFVLDSCAQEADEEGVYHKPNCHGCLILIVV